MCATGISGDMSDPGLRLRLRDAMQRAMARPELIAKLAELGVETRPLAAAELPAFGQQEVRRWAEAVKISGFKASE